MYSTSDFRRGLKIEFEGDPCIIVEFLHVKPGKGGAFVRTKLKSLRTGAVLDHTFRSGEKVGKPDLEEKEMQFMYEMDGNFYFMDTATYEQIFLSGEHMGETRRYLKEEMLLKILFYKREPIGVDPPIFVELKIVKTDPGLKGDTVSGGTKPAELESGAIIQVPLFLNEGDVIKVDTRTGEYIERV
ncbi:MAG: elongation factor P [Deltaproteobacteria bacterium]|nr:elongation factor P [Deltaproteobacteria bacterium]